MSILKRLFRICLALLLLLNAVAAFHAWKFTHFYPPLAYANKRPEQMNGWEKAGIILFGVRLSKSVTDTVPPTAYETVWLQASGPLKIACWYIPARGKASGTVILFHGYGSHKGNTLAEAGWFREQGYHTLLVDFRAHGNSEGYTCSIGYKEAEEVRLAYEYIRNRGEKHIILWGMSMGAAAILKAVPQYHLQPGGLVLESPFATLTDAVKGRMRAVNLPETPLSQLLAFWGGIEQGFWGPGFSPAGDARQVKAPVLLCWGRHDTRVTEAETMQLYRQLGSGQKRLLIFEASGHQSFCRNEPGKWKPAVEAFLKSALHPNEARLH